MNSKSAKMVMKCVGTTLAICSALAIAGGCTASSGSTSTKKFIKKTVNKMSDIVDAVATFM
ncbi:hypothetical protein [uncultured Eubacterium sp.]|uniref:hypothetical protein n=1 Tax=uncultured Eubacterium sp. TaxID=165185 RepID=UPI0015BC0C51|nr:hypothetical protein [uncultured Eubacterium sp.]